MTRFYLRLSFISFSRSQKFPSYYVLPPSHHLVFKQPKQHCPSEPPPPHFPLKGALHTLLLYPPILCRGLRGKLHRGNTSRPSTLESQLIIPLGQYIPGDPGKRNLWMAEETLAPHCALIFLTYSF